MGAKVRIESATFFFSVALPAVNLARLKFARMPLALQAVFSDEGLRELSLVHGKENPPARQNLERLRNPRKAISRFEVLRNRLSQRLCGKRVDMKWNDFDMRGRSDFCTRIWQAARNIPFGQAATYGEVAGDAGSPMAFQACGQACCASPIMIFIPCHRVVAAGGIGGYGCDMTLKKHLLALEGVDWTAL